MKTIIYFRHDVLLIFRRGIYAEPHRHHAIQITFSLDNPFAAELDGQSSHHRALVISSDYPHRVIRQDEWVVTLFLNPETPIAKAVQNHLLDGAPFQSLDFQLTHELLRPALERDLTRPELMSLLLHIRDLLLPRDLDVGFPDARIAEVLDIVEQTPDYKIAASELSEKVYLSESRFEHLFKEEVGIPLRRYLLWRRLMLAGQMIAQGENFTFAAHESGFTDSAHLSRTFYEMFGIRPSDMFGDRDLVRVIFWEPSDS